MSRELYFDQQDSFAARLQSAGISHGDTARGVVLRGVGVWSAKHEEKLHDFMSFCPSWVTAVDEIEKASAKENEKPMAGIVTASLDSLAEFRKYSGRHGFVDLSFDLRSNGSLHISNARVLNFLEAAEGQQVAYQGAFEDNLKDCKVES